LIGLAPFLGKLNAANLECRWQRSRCIAPGRQCRLERLPCLCPAWHECRCGKLAVAALTAGESRDKGNPARPNCQAVTSSSGDSHPHACDFDNVRLDLYRVPCDTKPQIGRRSASTFLFGRLNSGICRLLGRIIAMLRVVRIRWKGFSAAAWLVLAAMHALAPTQVQAGCSHPWVQASGISASLFDSSLLESGFQRSLPGPRSSPRSSDRRGPCADGSCSRSPELPPSSTGQISLSSEQWGNLPAGRLRMSPQSRVFSLKDDQRRPYRIPTPIERPPRLDSAR
jgi:hypothetical protein